MKIRLQSVLHGLAAMGFLGVAGVVLEFAALRGSTPGIDAPRSISSLERHEIGGVEQWILIRGHDHTKPVLLFLHGGPGMPAMFLAHRFQRLLERDFVVVHWDRRGAGKSFDAWSQTPALSVSQTLKDTYELTQSLGARFDQQRIYLVGHSWGSYLGLLAVEAHPEYYSAFIGMGQLAGTRDRVHVLRREFLYQALQRTGGSTLQARAAERPEAITEDDLFRLGGQLYASRSFWPILRTGLAAPEYTLRDALNVKKGADLVGREMKYDVMPKPLDGEIGKVDVPVFFFLGRHDYNTPSQLAAQYLERLDSPLKGAVWFEQSAHFPFFEEPDRFHRELLRAAQAVAEFWKNKANREVPTTSRRRFQPTAENRGGRSGSVGRTRTIAKMVNAPTDKTLFVSPTTEKRGMQAETSRLEEQLERALEGGAWHGPSVLEALEGVSAEQAAAHPIAGAHSIWELVLHLCGAYGLVLRRLDGDGRQLAEAEDWPTVPEASAENWNDSIRTLKQMNQDLRRAVKNFSGERLDQPLVPESPYTAYTQFIGVTQHDLYHAGQIALLKRALGADTAQRVGQVQGAV